MKFSKSIMQSPSTAEEKQKHSFVFIIVLIVLLFSTAVAGLLIADGTGKVQKSHIHTVVFDGSQRKTHVSGQILYQDGTPYQNGDLELHSQVLTTQTDQLGRFFYPSVELGSHTLTVVQNGETLAECAFTMQRKDTKQLVDITHHNNTQYLVELSVDVRFIELGIEIDQTQKTLKLIPEKTVVLTDEGIVSMDGKTMNVKDGVVILPSSTIILPDKTIVAKEYLVLPENAVIPIPDNGFETAGNLVQKDGTVILEDGTRIKHQKVIKPDGSVLHIDNPYQITDSPLKQSEDELASPSNKEPSNQKTPNKDTSKTDPLKPENPTLVQEKHLFADQLDGEYWTPWSSLYAVALFDNRSETALNKALQPGSKGSYSFRLRNDMKKALRYQLFISEKEIHIPMRFRWIDEYGNKGSWQTLIRGKATNIGSGTIDPGAAVVRIEWEWRSEGSDAADTEAGKAGKDYVVDVHIKAAEIE